MMLTKEIWLQLATQVFGGAISKTDLLLLCGKMHCLVTILTSQTDDTQTLCHKRDC